MNFVINMLVRIGILKDDLDYHLIRSSMVIIFLFFGYQKWFAYEAQALIPYISHGPLIFWMYPVFGVRGATYFLGASEWLFRNSRRARCLLQLYRHKHHYSIHARWLGGVGRRISGDDRARRFSDEGPAVSYGIVLSVEAGCSQSMAFPTERRP
jgi:hypothetical protein